MKRRWRVLISMVIAVAYVVFATMIHGADERYDSKLWLAAGGLVVAFALWMREPVETEVAQPSTPPE